MSIIRLEKLIGIVRIGSFYLDTEIYENPVCCEEIGIDIYIDEINMKNAEFIENILRETKQQLFTWEILYETHNDENYKINRKNVIVKFTSQDGLVIEFVMFNKNNNHHNEYAYYEHMYHVKIDGRKVNNTNFI